jgi:HK97 family phage portal protein
MATWTPTDGYFGTLLSALLGRAARRVSGERQDSGTGGGGATAVTPDTALKLSAVWACVKLISEAVGAMPIRVWQIGRDGTRTLTTEHWIHKLLNHSPNRYQTRNEFFETVVFSLEMFGNAYVRPVRRKDGSVVSLMPMMAPQMEVTLALNGDRLYKYTDGRNVAAFAQDNIWHMMLMPSNSIVGLSPLHYGARTMGIAMAAEDRVETLAANGFKPTGVLMIDKSLKPEQREQIRNQFADLQEGKGDPLKVLEAGMKYQAITMSPKDVQLLESRRFQIEDICRFYGTPSVLVNDTSATTVWGSGIGEIKEGYYTLKVQPLLERIESSISKWLLAPEERDKIAIEFDFAAFLRGNEKSRVEMATQAIAGNLMMIDEARHRFDGLPPLPDGKGQVMYAQSQMIPIGSSAPEGKDDDDPQPPEN